MTTRYEQLLEAIDIYDRRGVSMKRADYARLWGETAQAYFRGQLSDREYDDLLHRLYERT